MRMRSFSPKRRFSVHIVTFYVTVLFVIASTSIVIWSFKDECYQFHFPPSPEHLRKCEGWGMKQEVISFEVTEEPIDSIDTMGSDWDNLPFGHKKLGLRDLRTAMGPSNGINKPKKSSTYGKPLNNDQNAKEDKTEYSKMVQANVSDYFKDRREATKDSCLKMFYDEEGINFDDTNPDDFMGELKKLEKLERGEANKFFIQTNPQKRTKWIFYKHQDLPNNLEIEWCPLYKSASTPWMAIFTKLSKALTDITEAKVKSGKMTFLTLAKDFRLHIPRGDRHSRTNKAQKYSMVVVRHPFKRILSAYQDKIERVEGREYYRKFRKSILRKFPRSTQTINKISSGGGVPLWYVMALDLNKQYRRSGPSDDVNDNNARNVPTVPSKSLAEATKPQIKLGSKFDAPVPTFSEFCRNLLTLRPETMDEHWRPQYLDCSPCHHQFDFILKVESLEDDKDAIFKLLGFEDNVDKSNHDYNQLQEVWRKWTNPSVHNHNDSYYFSQLSEQVIQKLYTLYEPDFKLFGYSPDDYFDLVKGKDEDK